MNKLTQQPFLGNVGQSIDSHVSGSQCQQTKFNARLDAFENYPHGFLAFTALAPLWTRMRSLPSAQTTMIMTIQRHWGEEWSKPHQRRQREAPSAPDARGFGQKAPTVSKGVQRISHASGAPKYMCVESDPFWTQPSETQHVVDSCKF